MLSHSARGSTSPPGPSEATRAGQVVGAGVGTGVALAGLRLPALSAQRRAYKKAWRAIAGSRKGRSQNCSRAGLGVAGGSNCKLWAWVGWGRGGGML